jgi:hypothetical protein
MFLAALAVGIASSSGFAAERQLKQLSEAEIAQLEEVLPEKATVKPRQPRKLLIFWRCEGFFHEDAIAWSNKALEMIGEKTGAYTRSSALTWPCSNRRSSRSSTPCSSTIRRR